MSKKPSLAVVGATGAVGTVMLDILSKRKDVYGEIRLIASARSAGKKLTCRGQELTVVALTPGAFKGIDIALTSAGASISKEYADTITKHGAIMIDNSSAFRYDDDVPLVVPEVNPEDSKIRPRNIIANPNCSTIQMLVALKPLHDLADIKRIVSEVSRSTQSREK